ncbi:MAG: citrate synthase [Salinibacter sp.]
MTSDGSTSSVLFATEHGTARWAPDGRLSIALSGMSWTVSTKEIAEVHDALESLAGQVYRCDCDCRWQLRMGEGTAVLDTDDVLRLHSLLSGVLVMVELEEILEEADIDSPGVGNDGLRSPSGA